ncbi:hypothetical protein [Sphingopyxis panaciterrulae]|uniref:Xanthosine utilization system XapX-like protein n=1 Tax=Sphingopyxis panaciterrulae TaxID=462372 RepID=A0A7W9B7G5_9SPHN|nr:hypothetical protein [Sphingopyxis panaciterrulae]MBB5707392.1 xanthosine utilization system XapX-like protein [Sphingopyxis panaciterrulae]
MNGIFSGSPSPHVIRLLVAGLLFGVVQAAILLAAPREMPAPRPLIVVLGLLTVGSLAGAILGDRRVGPQPSTGKTP